MLFVLVSLHSDDWNVIQIVDYLHQCFVAQQIENSASLNVELAVFFRILFFQFLPNFLAFIKGLVPFLNELLLVNQENIIFYATSGIVDRGITLFLPDLVDFAHFPLELGLVPEFRELLLCQFEECLWASGDHLVLLLRRIELIRGQQYPWIIQGSNSNDHSFFFWWNTAHWFFLY